MPELTEPVCLQGSLTMMMYQSLTTVSSNRVTAHRRERTHTGHCFTHPDLFYSDF